MFTVYEKKTNQEVKVYDVQRDKNGYPQFLIRQDNQWIYRSAKHYSDTQKINLVSALCPHQWEMDHLRENRRTCKTCGREQVLFHGTWCNR